MPERYDETKDIWYLHFIYFYKWTSDFPKKLDESPFVDAQIKANQVWIIKMDKT